MKTSGSADSSRTPQRNSYFSSFTKQRRRLSRSVPFDQDLALSPLGARFSVAYYDIVIIPLA